jgi:hypothetical protein
MFARLPIICAAALTATAAATVDSIPAEKLRLACSGMLITDDQPGSPVTTSGVVDIANGWVSGFGMGGQSIVSLNGTRIAFGTGRTRAADPVIDGEIDRTTWKTEIAVQNAIGKPLMLMRLDCDVDGPVG